MNEKKSVKISLSTFFLILALIAIITMGIFMYKIYNEKKEANVKSSELQEQVNNLNETVSDLQRKIDTNSNNTNSRNTITSNTTSTNKTIIEGYYIFEDSDVGYEFDKKGNVSILGNVSEIKGTYTDIGENEIKLTLTEEIITDIDTGETTSTSMNRIETIKIVDDNTLLLSNDNANNQKLVRYTDN